MVPPINGRGQRMGLLYPTTVAKVEDRPAFGPHVSNVDATV